MWPRMQKCLTCAQTKQRQCLWSLQSNSLSEPKPCMQDLARLEGGDTGCHSHDVPPFSVFKEATKLKAVILKAPYFTHTQMEIVANT